MTDYWRAQARRYDRATLMLNRRFSELALAAAEAVEGAGEVLEIAAGTGLITQAVVEKVGKLVATDQSTAMLDLLRGRLAGHDNLTIQEADALALDFPDASFDAVLICNLLHLLPDSAVALSEARRVLRPGGLLVAPTFCHAQGMLAAMVSRLLGLTGFPIVTRFQGTDLDARWFSGILPVRFVVARAG
jgi:phosphatidylethanolamine/phosphatidyl-N-methylethanolamine N-methyltransferase